MALHLPVRRYASPVLHSHDKTIEKEDSSWLEATVRAASLEQNMIITLNLFWAGYGDGMPVGARGGKGI